MKFINKYILKSHISNLKNKSTKRAPKYSTEFLWRNKNKWNLNSEHLKTLSQRIKVRRNEKKQRGPKGFSVYCEANKHMCHEIKEGRKERRNKGRGRGGGGRNGGLKKEGKACCRKAYLMKWLKILLSFHLATLNCLNANAFYIL